MDNNGFVNDPTVIKEFIAEFTEHVQALELNILALEKDMENQPLLNEIFRPVHSLKGIASFLGFTNIVGFSHKLENLLDDLRKGRRKVSPGVIDIMLEGRDIIKRLIDDVAHGGNGSAIDASALVAKIEALTGAAAGQGAGDQGTPPGQPPAKTPKKRSRKTTKKASDNTVAAEEAGTTAPAPAPVSASAPAPVPDAAPVSDVETFVTAARQHLAMIGKALPEIEKDRNNTRAFDALFRAVHSLRSSAAILKFANLEKLLTAQEELLTATRKGGAALDAAALALCNDCYRTTSAICDGIAGTGSDAVEIDGLLAGLSDARKAADAARPPAPAAVPVEKKAPEKSDGGQQIDYTEHTIRVSMQKLDLLMNLVGELMIDKSRFDLIEHKIEAGEDLSFLARDLRDATGSMGRITDQLHTAIMDTRMVTIGTLFNRFPRVVRELARAKGQEIELAVSGEDTEIDKAIIEEINDPLVHLIRNAADHGIESPDERRQQGKPEKGTVFLRASHEGGNVVIEVEDDGKGMDVQLIKEKAVRNGIITKEQAEHMQEQEALNLIFLPGFSTKEVVTDISGRGVGMDVVKTNIEKLRGKVLIQTELHKGSKIILKLPLTMAIIETLMVKAGDEIFAIPILAVNTVSEVKQSDLQFIQGEMAVRLHDRTIGVVHLCDVFDIPRRESGKKIYLVVLEVKNSKGKDTEMGFIVDAVHDKQKIVIKPLDDSTVDMSGFSGVTILGDGRVALIIDPVELIDKLVMEKRTAEDRKQESQ